MPPAPAPQRSSASCIAVEHRRVLAHAEIIVGAPHRHLGWPPWPPDGWRAETRRPAARDRRRPGSGPRCAARRGGRERRLRSSWFPRRRARRSPLKRRRAQSGRDAPSARPGSSLAGRAGRLVCALQDAPSGTRQHREGGSPERSRRSHHRLRHPAPAARHRRGDGRGDAAHLLFADPQFQPRFLHRASATSTAA